MQENKLLETENRRLVVAVESREREVERMIRAIESGATAETPALQGHLEAAQASESSRQVIEQLNDQIDFLNSQLVRNIRPVQF